MPGSLSRREFLKRGAAFAAGIANPFAGFDQLQPKQQELLHDHRWGTREDGAIVKESIVFVGARRWNPDGSAVISSAFDMTSETGEYDPTEIPAFLQKLQELGINQIPISTWPRFGYNLGEAGLGETYPTDQAYRDMVHALEEHDIGFMPFVEFWGSGNEGTLPAGSVLQENSLQMITNFLVSYVEEFGNSPVWKKFYGPDGSLKLPFKLIESTTYGERDSNVFMRNLAEIARRVKSQTSQDIGFWLDNSLLPIDGSNLSQPVTLDASTVNETVLGSSIFNPNHLESYFGNEAWYVDNEGRLNERALREIDAKTRADLHHMVANRVPFHLPVMFGYFSSHLPYFGPSYRYAFGLDRQYYELFIKPLIRDFARHSTGITLGLANNTSEWNLILPTADGDTTLHDLARDAVTYYEECRTLA